MPSGFDDLFNTLSSVFSTLLLAVQFMPLLIIDLIGRLMGHPGFCSSPAYCI